MTVTVRNIIAGPATVHVAPEGTTEPTDALVDMPSGWRDVGGTTGGVRFLVNQSFADITVDQVVESVGKIVTDRTSAIATTFAESTLENWAVAVGELETAVSEDGDTRTLEPSAINPGDEPNYIAVCVTGRGPQGATRRVILRRVLSTESIESANSKTEQSGIPVTLTGHYVSQAVPSYSIVDTVPPVTP